MPTAASTNRHRAEHGEHGGENAVARKEAVDILLRRVDEVEGQVRIDLRHLAPERGNQALGPLAPVRLDHDRRELGGGRRLRHGPGRRRVERHVESRVVHVRVVERTLHADGGHDAHDGPPRAVGACLPVPGAESPADRARGAEVLLRECRVDDGDRQLRVEVVVGEGAALEEFLSDGLVVTAGHLFEVGRRAITSRLVDLAFDLDRGVAGEGHPEPAGDRGGGELPGSLEFPEQAVVEELPRFGARVVSIHEAHPCAGIGLSAVRQPPDAATCRNRWNVRILPILQKS